MFFSLTTVLGGHNSIVWATLHGRDDEGYSATGRIWSHIFSAYLVADAINNGARTLCAPSPNG
jgi:hypothetical protein